MEGVQIRTGLGVTGSEAYSILGSIFSGAYVTPSQEVRGDGEGSLGSEVVLPEEFRLGGGVSLELGSLYERTTSEQAGRRGGSKRKSDGW